MKLGPLCSILHFRGKKKDVRTLNAPFGCAPFGGKEAVQRIAIVIPRVPYVLSHNPTPFSQT